MTTVIHPAADSGSLYDRLIKRDKDRKSVV